MSKSYKTISDYGFKIGSKFLKGENVLIIVRVAQGKAIMLRSRRGNMNIYESVPLPHLAYCTNQYMKIEEEEIVYE